MRNSNCMNTTNNHPRAGTETICAQLETPVNMQQHCAVTVSQPLLCMLISRITSLPRTISLVSTRESNKRWILKECLILRHYEKPESRSVVPNLVSILYALYSMRHNSEFRLNRETKQ